MVNVKSVLLYGSIVALGLLVSVLAAILQPHNPGTRSITIERGRAILVQSGHRKHPKTTNVIEAKN